MRHFCTIFIMFLTVVILTLSSALAKSKFKNEDTAKNRQDNIFGTDTGNKTATTTFGTNAMGDTTIKSKAKPKEEPVDWYDNVIIAVDPDIRWPKDQPATSKTNHEKATDTEGGTKD